MKKFFLPLLLVSILILGMASLASAADDLKQVTVKGYGTSRDEALNDALRNAVEQAVGTLVDSQTLVKNAEVVDDEIYTKSQGFVQDYDIIDEQKNNGQVVVTAKVKINTSPNSALMTKLQKLKLIEVGLRDPRIGVIIPEYHITKPIPDPAGETAVIRKLREAGFNRIVDPKQLQNIRYRNTIKSIAAGNKKEAIALATKYHLDYLIVGEAFSEYFGSVEGSMLVSSRARVEARLFKVDTGEIIATNGFHASGVDITEAISAKTALHNAGEMMGDYMVEQLMTYASNPEKGLQLLVKGVTSFNKVSILEDELKQIKGVKNVFVRDYSAGVATIDINYTGAPKTLAAALEKLSNVNLDVAEVSNSAIQAIMKY